jgi:ribosome-associated heat shock protein Hsp15
LSGGYAIAIVTIARARLWSVNDDNRADRHRIDKWLWHTRFFKTRSVAAQAVTGGKVHLNGERVKPAHIVQVGDCVGLTINGVLAEFDVLGLPARRGPATEAQAQYSERPASLKRRAKHRQAQQLADLSRPRSDTKPDKRDRRRLMKFQRGEG